MDWKKIAPWNWFKHEESLPVSSGAPGRAAHPRFATLRAEIDRLFEDAFTGPARLAGRPGALPAPLRPSVDIGEGRKAYTVRAEIPGVDVGDVSLEVEDRTLVLRGEKRAEREEEEEGMHCVERSYGVFQRVLSLPDDADTESIDARFKNGVLTLRIPKHATSARGSRHIDIRQG